MIELDPITSRSGNEQMKNSEFRIEIDSTKDDLLTDFSKAVLRERYLQEHETFQDIFARVAKFYADNIEHATRLYKYISNLWFLPATPILSNGGTERGLPISCFLNEVSDSLRSIADTWNENVWLAAHGGGIGTYWGNVRSIGEKVKNNGKTSGIIPFICVSDRLSLAISQGSLRRGSSAVYIPIHHPEIEEFLEIRRPTGGDPNRKALNMHHGVIVTDKFMQAVIDDAPWELLSPKNHDTVKLVRARDLWIRLLLARIETGEPYIIFIDAVNRNAPEVYKNLGLCVNTSNLCSEITLATGLDHKGQSRTAVCCLASVNLLHFDQWQNDDHFIPDIVRFLDNVLQNFIEKGSDEHARAKYAAYRERSLGLGVMGFHSLLQEKMIPFDSIQAKDINKHIFKHISERAILASSQLALEKGACPDALDCGLNNIRNTHVMAIAPTATISIIAGSISAGIEPFSACCYNHKTLDGSFLVKNPSLKKLLNSKGRDTEDIWSSIMQHDGSVQHLGFLNENEKAVFKTAFEINQNFLIDHAADRTPYICQSQSLNFFLRSDVHKRTLNELHIRAWKSGLKSLYYLRSKSMQRAEYVSYNHKGYKSYDAQQMELPLNVAKTPQDDCTVCQ